MAANRILRIIPKNSDAHLVQPTLQSLEGSLLSALDRMHAISNLPGAKIFSNDFLP